METLGSETVVDGTVALFRPGAMCLLVVGAGLEVEETVGSTSSVLGVDAAELSGRSLSEALPALSRTVAELESRPGPAMVELGGRTIALLFERRAHDGGRAFLVAIDVTDHHRWDLATRDLDRRNRRLFSQFPGAAWAIDRELRITHFLGRMPDLLGIAEDEIEGTSLYELLGTRNPAEPAIAHHLAALAGQRSSFRYRVRRRLYEVHVEPLRDEEGAIIGCLGAAVDATARADMERRVETSEELLARSEALAHVGTFHWEIASNELTWSDELLRMHGLDRKSFDGTFEAFARVIHPEDLDYTKKIVFDALRDPQPFHYRHRIVRPDGSIRMLQTSATVTVDEGGRPVRMAGACFDVTEEWQAKQQLERSVSLLESTIEATADGLLIVDNAGRVAAYNRRFLALWEIPHDLAERRDDKLLLDFVGNQLTDPEDFLRGVRDLYLHKEEESFDVLRFRDGRVFERYSRPQSIGKQVIGRVWSFRDVSDRERLLRRASFLADASRLLISLDVEHALEGVAHLAVPFLADACAFDLFGDGEPRRLLALSRDSGSPMRTELPSTVLAGHSVIQDIAGAPQLSVPLFVRGEVTGALTLAASAHRRFTRSDVEFAEELARRAGISIENARLYRSTRDAVHSREEFLSVAAHEIRGPLTALRFAVQTLRKGNVDSERLLGIIEREERRLARFVDDLLDLGRVQSGRMQFVFEPVDLAQVVREAAARSAGELAKAGSSISLRIAGEAIGNWDRLRIEQIVTNLLTNAIKYGMGKPIEIGVTTRNGTAQLTVADHGIGIPPDRQEAIFEPFERAVTARRYGGFGLGLYIVQKIVRALGGTIQLRSSPGAGSTFTVDLPLSGSEAREPMPNE